MDLRSLVAAAAVFTFGCDDGPSMSESLKQADEKEKARKEAEKKAAADVKVAPKDPNKLEDPWTFDAVKANLAMGTLLTYKMSGTNEKGKPVDDQYNCELKGNNEKEVGITAYRESEKAEPIASQVAKYPWSKLSPFFALERAEHKLVGQESVTVPAGTFDCVVVEMSGFFGNKRTVWMIKDKPGVYAKVVDHGNESQEDDQTDVTYELLEIGKR